MDPGRVDGFGCLAIADERTRERAPASKQRLATFTSAAGNGGWDDTARMETRQFGITPEQACSGIAAGLYCAGLLHPAGSADRSVIARR